MLIWCQCAISIWCQPLISQNVSFWPMVDGQLMSTVVIILMPIHHFCAHWVESSTAFLPLTCNAAKLDGARNRAHNNWFKITTFRSKITENICGKHPLIACRDVTFSVCPNFFFLNQKCPYFDCFLGRLLVLNVDIMRSVEV